MQREVTDQDSTTWSCAQAHAGLSEELASARAAQRAADHARAVMVVCTPSGGAKSVHIKVPPQWQEQMSDAELLAAIDARRDAG